MYGKCLAALVAACIATPAIAQPPTLEETIAICRTAFFIDPAKGKLMFEAVPEEHQHAVAIVCLSYRQGAEDMLAIVEAQRQKKPISHAAR